MSDTNSNLWPTRSVTFLLAGLAAASGGFWTLHWPEPSNPPKALALEQPLAAADATKVAALLGDRPAAATPNQPSAAANLQSRFKLWGVIAQSQSGHQGARGSALLAVDGAPPKPYRVGQWVVDDLTLQSVLPHSVTLGTKGQSNASVTLELPAPPGVITPQPRQ